MLLSLSMLMIVVKDMIICFSTKSKKTMYTFIILFFLSYLFNIYSFFNFLF